MKSSFLPGNHHPRTTTKQRPLEKPTAPQHARLPPCLRGRGHRLRRRLRPLPRQEDSDPEPQRCMTRAEADHLVDVYARSIAAFSGGLLQTYLAKSFVDVSDSINIFIHRPLGPPPPPTFESKEVFIEKQRTGAHFPVEVLSVALQWVSYFGRVRLPAKGADNTEDCVGERDMEGGRDRDGVQRAGVASEHWGQLYVGGGDVYGNGARRGEAAACV